MKKKGRFIIALLIVSSILMGCTQSSNPNNITQNENSNGANGQIKEISREKTLIFENIDGRVPLPENQNPYQMTQYIDWGLWQANQESLFYYNYETGEIVPWQASGYEYSEDFTGVKIFIREGVSWQDGEVFNADDVVFTINMLKENPELHFGADMAELVVDVTANNEYEVEFTLSKATPNFIMDYFSVKVWNTLLIAPEHIWKDVDPLTFNNYDLEKGYPLGTGPYKLVRSTETEQVYDLCDSWWGADSGFTDMPEPERCIWLTAGSEELRSAMLVNNELDAAWTFGRGNWEQAQAKNENLIAWTEELPYGYLDAGVRGLYLNNDVAPFDNSEVRRAINHAIIRDEIVAVAYEGLTEPAYAMYPVYPTLQEFLDENEGLFEKYETKVEDVEKTKEIMQSQGYVLDDEGFWVDSENNRITFTIYSRSGESDKMKVGPILIQQLRNAGFDCDFQSLESAAFFDETRSGRASAWLYEMLASVADPYSTFEMYHSKYYKPIGELPSKNETRYQNEEYDAIIDEMSVLSADDPRFNELASQAFDIWLRDMPTIPLTQAYLLTPFNNTYWTNWPSAENNYVHPGHWWVTCNLIIHEVKAVN